MNRLLRPRRRPQHLNDADLALNLSFVLHEHSQSVAVRSAIRAIGSHARFVAQVGAGLVPALPSAPPARPSQGRYKTGPYFFGSSTGRPEPGGITTTVSECGTAAVTAGITHWITATIGLPDRLADALGVIPDTIIRIDAGTSPQQPNEFFRAPSQLALPAWPECHIGVAALILRPDRQTSQLIVHGPFDWPTDQRAAIRAVEQVIQAHVGQWMPPRALWSAPAEVLMPDEVYLGRDDASRMS